MKKVISLNEEIKRMKSLMGEERLYGNLIDYPPKKKIIKEQVPWKAVWQAVKAGVKESPDMALTLISKSYISKVNKALSNIPESGIISVKEAQEIMNIARGLSKNTKVADDITKIFKLSKIPLDGADINGMRNMLVNMQALILRGVAKGDNSSIIAKDINKITKSNAITSSDVTDFAHLVFNSPSINKVLGESKLAKSLKDLTKVEIDTYFKSLKEMVPGDIRMLDDFKNMKGIPVSGLDEATLVKILKEFFRGFNFHNIVIKFIGKTGKTLFLRIDIPPLTKWISKFTWGKNILNSSIMSGNKKFLRFLPSLSLANSPFYVGMYACISNAIAPWIMAMMKKSGGEIARQDKTTIMNLVGGCIGEYFESAPKTIPKGIILVDNTLERITGYSVKDLYTRDKAILRNNFKNWLIDEVCKEGKGKRMMADGTIGCDWEAVQSKYGDCQSLLKSGGMVDQYQEVGLEEKWWEWAWDYSVSTLGVEEHITKFKDAIAEQLTDWPGFQKWCTVNLQLKWDATKEELEDMLEEVVDIKIVDAEDAAKYSEEQVIIDMIKKLKGTGLDCGYLLQWKLNLISEEQRESGEYDQYGDGQEGFKTWYCNHQYGKGTDFESDPGHVSACKKAVDQWCP